jgi:putative nucleotidyltransferase with HDIG domain
MPINSGNAPKDYLGAVNQNVQRSRAGIVNPAERYLNRVASLPPAPMLVTQLLKLFREPDRDVDEIVQLISYEPSLTAQILRTCNSAFFAGEQPPSDIFEAITRLGFYQVYCLVVSTFGAKARAMEGADKGVDVEELWRHSVAVAVSASIVEEDTGQAKAAAFTAGLLHDIGKLVLASVERERYAELFQRAKNKSQNLCLAERSSFGSDHAELGGELLRRWNLPPDVVAAVRYHHAFDGAPPYHQLTASVLIGDVIGHQLFSKDVEPEELAASCDEAMTVIGLQADDLPRLFSKAQKEMDQVKGLLAI